ncbi:ATP-binding protein [Patescibacteria group bacterium]|nr:ATP-binding protein [Patescibacteria group bacterium]
MEKLQFRISSATKSILGKDLIVDKNIAIFELVKNAYDASAEKVDIYINDEKITIIDNGEGMDINDIKNKWLYVGYSEKSDNKNIIKKGSKRRTFAGAKGIGRLACDRLGKDLRLISIKNKKIEQLDVNWGDFEKSSKIDFNKIDIEHTNLKKSPSKEFKKGTILEITSLRERWDEEDLKKLKSHLIKLISPVKEDKEVFDIFIHYYEEKAIKINNFIFDKLGLKTTQIDVEVSLDGKFITTELIDRGDRIYKIIEKNKWSKKTANIKFQLFYLSPPTKLSFWHSMKIDSVNFGSVFLYKNGFRVYPYGNPGDDSLGLDRRKGQGRTRHFGTREVIGNIIINNTSDEFKETSSRDGGLLNTKGFQELKELFKKNVLRRLEIYAIDTLKWTYDGGTQKEFFPEEKENEIKKLIQKLTKSNDFVSLEYDYSKFEKQIEKKVNEGFQGATGVLKKQAEKTNNIKLKKAVEKIEKVQKEQKDLIRKQETKIEKKDEQVSALKSFTNKDLENLQSYHHQIGISTKTIDNYILHSFNILKSKKYEKLEKYLQKIKKENDKINSIARFATGSGMNELAIKKERSLNNIIKKYLKDDYIPVASDGLEIQIKDNTTNDFITSFRPFDISMIFDNLLDNAKKAKANNCVVELCGGVNVLEVFVKDNGVGINKRFKDNIEEIFDLKTSSTDGAGIGLFNVQEILTSIFNASISVKQNTPKKGLTFTLTFTK